MINIFKDGLAAKSKDPSKAIKRRKDLEAKLREDLESRGRANLDKLNPMVIPLLSISNDGKSGFITSSIDAIQNSPHSLTENWINHLNSWVDTKVLATMLDEPDVIFGERIDIGPVHIIKIIPPKPEATYPSAALILADKRGWRWYVKTSKAYSFSLGDLITLRAVPYSHGNGITFLRRPSKILKKVKLMEDSND